MSNVRRVLVVGGGVGGLSAAVAFARQGSEVLLIEKANTFDVPGVGLGQPANALRVYDALGVLTDILDSGFIYDRMFIFGPDRDLIVTPAAASDPAGGGAARRRGRAHGAERR
jgi:2-polyprenyl-6-methoxyphenol hydroxylase-like FAD-dependent oxidoreductase